MNTFLNKLRSFYNGYFFPICIALIVLMGHIYGLIYLGVLLTVILCGAGFLISKDLKFFISPLLCSYFIISKDILENEALYSTPSIVFFAVCIIVLIACITAHFIIYRAEVSVSSLKKSALTKGFLAISLLFVMNGMLAFDLYNTTNIVFGILIAVSFILPFFIFSVNLKVDEKTMNYLIYILFITSALISIEFISFYVNDVFILDGKIFKNSIVLGWGISNNIGAMFAMLMPIYFLKITTSKFCLPYFLGAAVSFLMIIFTMSRTSMLISLFILLCCILYLCIKKHRNRKKIIVYSLLSIAVGISFVALYWSDLYKAFGQIIDVGFSDSGRFEYYIDGINKFLDHPILGVGFGNSHGVNDKFVIAAPEFFHNTIVQVLASCGILGFIAYAFHRYETVKLFAKNRGPLSFFTAMIILTLLLTSLLDIHMFNIFPAIFYSVILCIFERHTREIANVPCAHGDTKEICEEK